MRQSDDALQTEQFADDATSTRDVLRRLERFVENIPHPLSYLNLDLRYEIVNAAFLRGMKAENADNIIGRHYTEVRDAETVTAFAPNLSRALRGEKCTIEWMPDIGVQGRRWLRTDFYPDVSDAGEVVGIYVIATDIHDLKVANEKERVLAMTDTLTGLPNRLALSGMLERLLAAHPESGLECAVLFIDLDGFKGINDTHGHRFGDSVLVACARRMHSAMREQDTVGRLAGDEFLAIVVGASREDALAIGQRLIEQVGQPLRIDSQQVTITASVGIAFFPTDGLDFDTLMRASDSAMYRAKAQGKNQMHAA